MKFKQKLIWCKGLPGSTKSTWARQYQKENGTDKVKIVDKDSIREMIDQSEWSKANEKLVLQIEDEIILKSLIAGYTVIVHDTNFGDKHPERFKNLAAIAGVEVECQDFTHVPLETCIANDLKRNRSVGEAVIRKMWKQFLSPSCGVDRARNPEYVEHRKELQDIIVCDLDGTLALLNGRNPYDASTCYNDKVNKPVFEVLFQFWYSGRIKKVVFCSGRQDKWMAETDRWLREVVGFGNSVPYELHMRKTNDTRKDCDVKQEMYDNCIKDKYNVVLVLDDRDQVIDVWRSNGLAAFQVNYGSF